MIKYFALSIKQNGVGSWADDPEPRCPRCRLSPLSPRPLPSPQLTASPNIPTSHLAVVPNNTEGPTFLSIIQFCIEMFSPYLLNFQPQKIRRATLHFENLMADQKSLRICN